MKREWDKAFRTAESARDIYTLVGYIGESGIAPNPDKVTVERLERVTSNGLDIGLSRVCLTTVAETGLAFEGDSFSAILAGLRRVSQQPGIELGAVKLLENNGKANAVVSGFCLLLRD